MVYGCLNNQQYNMNFVTLIIKLFIIILIIFWYALVYNYLYK